MLFGARECPVALIATEFLNENVQSGIRASSGYAFGLCKNHQAMQRTPKHFG